MLLLKLSTLFQRLLSVLILLPVRTQRLGRHIWNGLQLNFLNNAHDPKSGKFSMFAFWLLELCIYSFEIFGLGELYETINDFVKFRSRPLRDWEIEMAKEVYGNSINYQRVRIDEHSYLGPRQKQFCYVSFYMINSWGPMSESTLIHELMHVWQYERIGAVYMPRALMAQQTELGYNYGGVVSLSKALEKKADLTSFNLEQQADIVSDYFRIKKGLLARWGDASQSDLPVYEYFKDQLHTKTNT